MTFLMDSKRSSVSFSQGILTWIDFRRSRSFILRRMGTGSSSLRMSTSSVKILRPERRSRNPISTAFLIRFWVCLPSWKPNRCSKRIARKTLVGSSTKLRLWSTRITFSLISLWAPKKSISSPNTPLFNLMARVLMVKSRRYKSLLMELVSTVGRAAGES